MRCVRCGSKVFEKRRLRCKDCMKFVNAELEGKINKPRTFYFTYHRKCRNQSNVLDAEKQS